MPASATVPVTRVISVMGAAAIAVPVVNTVSPRAMSRNKRHRSSMSEAAARTSRMVQILLPLPMLTPKMQTRSAFWASIFSEPGSDFEDTWAFDHPKSMPAPRYPPAYGNVAGEEKGLVASTTNITSASRPVEPQLETCNGVSAP